MLFKYTKQPAKGIYLATQILFTLLARLPIWCLLGASPIGRQKRTWSFKRALSVRFTKSILRVIYNVGPLKPTPNFRKLVEGEGIKGTWVPGVEGLLFGDIKAAAEKNNIKSIRIPGYWYDKPGSSIPVGTKPTSGEKIAYCIHGGSYTSMTAANGDLPENIARGLLQHCNSIKRAFSIEYRLCTSSPFPQSGAFPSALIDALSGYMYLLDLGFTPEDIVLVGDSAGGNLALALVRYLLEYSSETSIPPPPASLILLCPWADLGDSHLHQGTDKSNRPFDYIMGSGDSHAYTRAGLCGSLDDDVVNTSKYFSPASRFLEKVSFAGFPRTFLTAGGSEMLFDQINSLREKMSDDLGDELVFHVQPNAVHDWVLFLWHEPERTDTLKQIATWLE